VLSEAELRVIALGGRQAGYVTRRQALACGLPPGAVDRRVQSGRWKLIKTGLHLMAGFEDTVKGRLVAATAALGAVVSHESAAELHDFPAVRRGLAVVTVRIRTTNRFPDVIVHQSTDLTDDQVVAIEALAVTSPIRTTIDLAARLRPPEIGRIIDRLVIDGRATMEAVCFEVVRLARHGKPGIKCMRTVLEPRIGETSLGESEIEAMALRLFREWDLPDPVMQLALPWRFPRRGRVDFAYPQARLIIEVDGRAWHSTLEAFEGDRLRDNHAQLAGWRVLRITYRMLKEQPEMVRNMIRRALEMPAA
jgi:hypothetical protein